MYWKFYISRSMTTLVLGCVLFFVQSKAVILAQTAVVDKTAAGKEYVYKSSAGKQRKMEIYFPVNHDPAKTKVPGLILFHGGGWTGGNLGQFRHACAYFASRGLVCATAEYRMLTREEISKEPINKKRVCIIDAKSAIRWFKQHAAELGIDPNRIITGGGSAGGHISALATLNTGTVLNDPADPKDIDTSVVAYLWFNPAFAQADADDPEIDMLRHLKKEMAPSIVFYGDRDTWKQGWDAVYAKRTELGITNIELQIAPGQQHGFFNSEPWRTVTLLAADQFLVKQGLLTGKSNLPMPVDEHKLIPAHNMGNN